MTDAVSVRRYLAAVLPLLPAERSVTCGAAPPDTPFALTETHRGGLRLAALSAAALALGLAAGMTLADARARVPDLGALSHDPAADAALLARLADACERYTPMVATDGADALVLDLTGCPPGLGMAEPEIARDLVARLARLGLSARTAIAGTPDAALALARFDRRAVVDLPVEALALSDDTHLALRRAGLTTLGDLAGRPRAPLAARFGTMLPLRLARLLGEEDPRITPRRAPPPILADRRFAEPLASADPVIEVIRDLAAETGASLAERDEGGRRFEASLFRTDGHVARLAVEVGVPVRAADAVARLFRERIEALADPLDPGFGYDMMRLAVPVVEPLAPAQAGFDDAAATPDLAPLLDRLAIRFGAASVRRFHARDEHFPEYAACLRAAAAGPSPLPWPVPEPGEPPLRPLYLFDPPQPVTVIAEVPDGPPRRFDWRGAQHRVVRHEGPERIAYPWWRRTAGQGLTRDYYRVEDESGHRFWLFRHGLFGECLKDGTGPLPHPTSQQGTIWEAGWGSGPVPENAPSAHSRTNNPQATPHWYLHGLFA